MCKNQEITVTVQTSVSILRFLLSPGRFQHESKIYYHTFMLRK